MPTVFSDNSTPVNLLLFHSPFFKASFAGTMCLALASNKETANSAADVIFEVGAFTTITPREVAVATSTLSNPTPARAITFKFLAFSKTSASTLVADLTSKASASTIFFSNSSLFEPSQVLISKSGPSALTVAGDNSSAIKTIGLDILKSYLLALFVLQACEQYLTSFQFLAHAFRQVIFLPQRTQIFSFFGC